MKTALSIALAALLLVSPELAVLGPAAQAIAPKRVRDQPIWRGRSGNFILTWTTSDLRAVLADKPAQGVFSVIPGVKRSFEAFVASLRAPQAGSATDPGHCTYERTFKILSVVGSLLSVEEAYYAFCQGWAHPAVETRLTALHIARTGELACADSAAFPPIDLDLSGSGKAVQLTDIAAAPDILRAFLNEPIIRKTLANIDQEASARTPQELQQLLADQSLEIGRMLLPVPGRCVQALCVPSSTRR